jgi:hypothetical protein
MQSVGAAAASSTVPDLLLEAREFIARQVDALLKGGPEAAARDAQAGYEQALRDTGFRHAELRGHALDAAAVSALSDALGEYGLAMHHAPLHHGGMVVAWAIQAWRPGAA